VALWQIVKAVKAARVAVRAVVVKADTEADRVARVAVKVEEAVGVAPVVAKVVREAVRVAPVVASGADKAGPGADREVKAVTVGRRDS
jgi:hypothetical protein